MKPPKPYPTYPLTPHVRGGWAKKYKGRLLYIPIADPTAALEEFHRRARLIDTGQAPTPPPASDPTIGQIVTRYCLARCADYDGGRIAA